MVYGIQRQNLYSPLSIPAASEKSRQEIKDTESQRLRDTKKL